MKQKYFLEFSCFLYDTKDAGNLFSGSCDFSKSSLNIWNFLVHMLLKPSLKNFEHYFASMGNECNCAVLGALFGFAFLWNWNEKWPFLVLWPLLSFQIFCYIDCGTLITLSFRISNSSTGIPSPPLALFIMMLPKVQLTLHVSCLALGEWSYHCGYLGQLDLLCKALLWILDTYS